MILSPGGVTSPRRAVLAKEEAGKSDGKEGQGGVQQEESGAEENEDAPEEEPSGEEGE